MKTVNNTRKFSVIIRNAMSGREAVTTSSGSGECGWSELSTQRITSSSFCKMKWPWISQKFGFPSSHCQNDLHVYVRSHQPQDWTPSDNEAILMRIWQVLLLSLCAVKVNLTLILLRLLTAYFKRHPLRDLDVSSTETCLPANITAQRRPWQKPEVRKSAISLLKSFLSSNWLKLIIWVGLWCFFLSRVQGICI